MSRRAAVGVVAPQRAAARSTVAGTGGSFCAAKRSPDGFATAPGLPVFVRRAAVCCCRVAVGGSVSLCRLSGAADTGG